MARRLSIFAIAIWSFVFFGETVVYAQFVEVERRVRDPQSGLTRRIYFHFDSSNKGIVHRPFRADDFIQKFSKEMGYDQPASELRVEKEINSLSGQRYRFRQYISGIPVYRGDVILSIKKDGQPMAILNDGFVPTPAVASMTTGMAKEAAVGIAAKEVLAEGETPSFSKAMPEILVVGDTAYICYRVHLVPSDYRADWLVWVDASTGEIRGKEDRITHPHAKSADIDLDGPEPVEGINPIDLEGVNGTKRGRGRVFDPDPRSAMRDDRISDGEDSSSAIPMEAYLDVVLLGLNVFEDGLFRLSGQFAQSIEFESPVRELASEKDPRLFIYDRSDPRFEEVNIYFHLDQNQRYIQSLGYDGRSAAGIQMGSIEFDAHGLWGGDNSHFIPSMNRLAFGDGGVDDGEDPDVILHEYGHAIQYGINDSWGGGHQRAMGEGFGDYWAASYNRDRAPGFRPNWVFMWDGHNEFWDGRVLDADLSYPEDANREEHAAGMLWSAMLWEIRNLIGDRKIADTLILEHHFGLGSRSTMEDAAREILLADIALFGGVHVPELTRAMNLRGFFP